MGGVAEPGNVLAGVELPSGITAEQVRQFMVGVGLNPDNAATVEQFIAENFGDAGEADAEGDDRRVPFGPRRRDTPTPENKAKLERQELGRIGRDRPPSGPGMAGLPEDAAYGLIGQDRARAERAGTGDAEYGLIGQDFARADRGSTQEGPAGDETRRSMERETTRTAGEIKMEALRMDDAEIARIAAKMIDVGLLPEDYDRGQFEKAWADLVDKAARRFQVNPDQYLTPEDMIDLYGSAGAPGIGSARQPGQPGGPSVTDVTTGIQLSDSTQAWGLLRGMLRSELGRNPSDAEVDSFQAALNEAQTAAPVVTTSTQSTDLAGNRTVNQTKTGGMDEKGFAEGYVEDEHDEEYGNYQAATTYADAMMRAIRSPV